MRLLRTVIDILADAQEQSDFKPKVEGKGNKLVFYYYQIWKIDVIFARNW